MSVPVTDLCFAFTILGVPDAGGECGLKPAQAHCSVQSSSGCSDIILCFGLSHVFSPPAILDNSGRHSHFLNEHREKDLFRQLVHSTAHSCLSKTRAALQSLLC